ncbi:MAG: DUF512 domain-containing protein, partial [Oscillospiraceae bacterium]|nr:DUF512 domain-containing protein [Oscillospiraceae bacterium]
LAELYPAVQSIAAVPAGLTAHRAGLAELRPYTKEGAAGVLGIIGRFNERFYAENGRNLCYPADEFFLKAGVTMPDIEYYGDFPQLDNGVGIWALFKGEFLTALDETEIKPKKKSEHITMITGVLATGLIEYLAAAVMQKFPGINIDVLPVKNKFFGESVTVAGLVTGKDIIEQATGRIKPGRVLIPYSMLKSREEKVFLDDMTLKNVEKALKVKMTPVKPDGKSFLKECLGSQVF